MFTGIVQCIAEIRSLQRGRGLMELCLHVPLDLSDSRVGDSFCIQGACLTAVNLAPHTLRVEVSQETLERTTLGSHQPGRPVNLERALKLSDLLGGHLVTGHVDGTGRVLEVRRAGDNVQLRVEADPRTARYLVEKGSICLDGVSLTLGVCRRDTFAVHVIPHTLAGTTLKFLRSGDRVNLEADLIGKYVEKLLAGRGLTAGGPGEPDTGFWERHGFSPGSKE